MTPQRQETKEAAEPSETSTAMVGLDLENPQKNTPDDKRIPALWAALSCFSYGFVSIATTLANKSVLDAGFNFSFTLVLGQSVLVIVLYRLLGSLQWVALKSFSLPQLLQIAPMTAFQLLNVLFSLLALDGLNVPMYNTLKRMTTVVTLVLEWWFLSKPFQRPVVLSILVIVIGTLVAGFGDLTFELLPYVYALAGCFVQGVYLVLIAKTGAGTETVDMVYMHSVLSAPILFVICVSSGELAEAVQFPALVAADQIFLAKLVSTIVLGAALNITIFWCTQTNSPLTTTVVGQMKNVLTTVFGFLLFDSKMSWLGVGGIVINGAGGILYSVVKAQAQKS